MTPWRCHRCHRARLGSLSLEWRRWRGHDPGCSMALEHLAGPFLIINRLNHAPVGNVIAGAPICRVDGRGLLLPISSEGVYLVSWMGPPIRWPRRSNDYGLALIGTGSAPVRGRAGMLVRFARQWRRMGYRRRHAVQNRPGGRFLYLPRSQLCPALRPLRLSAGRSSSVAALDLSAPGTIEASMDNLTHAVGLCGQREIELVVGSSDNLIARYDWLTKPSSARCTIRMTCRRNCGGAHATVSMCRCTMPAQPWPCWSRAATQCCRPLSGQLTRTPR